MYRKLSILLFILVQCDFSLCEDKINKLTDVHWVAPSFDQWEEADLDSRVKAYWASEWSKAIYEPSCSEDLLKIVPVYFWPGERIDLNCAMCELAFIFNGKMKNWAKIDDIIEFAESPQSVVADQSKYKLLHNDAWMENPLLKRPAWPNKEDDPTWDKMPWSSGKLAPEGKEEQKDPPSFIQRNGRLTILRASPSVQGVYFCFDQESRPSTSLFYVLQAMVPPVTLSTDKAIYTDGCNWKKQLVPMFNWKHHFIPAVRYEPHLNCTYEEFKDKEQCQAGPYVNITAGKDKCNTFEHCRADLKILNNNLISDLNLAVELRWSEWSKCDSRSNPNQGREAHCYLTLKNGDRIPSDDLADDISWISKLNDLFNLPPFDKEGIRLYSSLIPSLIYEQKFLTGCTIKQTKGEQFEMFYRNYILHAMGLQTPDGKPIKRSEREPRRLETAFQACFSYESGDSWEHMIGTYMVETRPCP